MGSMLPYIAFMDAMGICFNPGTRQFTMPFTMPLCSMEFAQASLLVPPPASRSPI